MNVMQTITLKFKVHLNSLYITIDIFKVLYNMQLVINTNTTTGSRYM